MLWKVFDVDIMIYLFGMIHVLLVDVFWYCGKVVVVFEGLKELVIEIIEVDFVSI